MVLAAALSIAMPAFGQGTAPMTPDQAIAAASAANSHEVSGVFEFTVGSTGASGFNAYLNSAADYHDAANLSAELHADVVNKLHAKLGGFPQDLLKGKRVRIKGVARRVPITKRDGTQYFQTRIDVDTIDQIEVLG
ncbi:MAG: hypothetical protein E7773_12530 [Sphingomonas sp.]|nr:MAG: hypothetical protein E7773_12530 [Sphingomonas sp.]